MPILNRRQLAGSMAAAAATAALPAGTDWHDFWTGKQHTGGSKLQVESSHADIPVFIRANCLMPWADRGMHAGTAEARQLHVRVYGNGSNGWQGAGEDMDGLSFSYAAGKGSSTPARGAKRAYRIAGWTRMDGSANT